MPTKECRRLGLEATEILNDDDVEVLRLIRNACRDGFAHDNEPISEAAQHAWWIVMQGRVRAWLYVYYGGLYVDTVLPPETVGYGLLRQTDDGRWWASVGVLPDCTGHGFGSAIMADVIRRGDGEVWSSARLDNVPAQKIHRADDWEEVGRDERLVHFRTRGRKEPK